jgi:hypothetical protein
LPSRELLQAYWRWRQASSSLSEGKMKRTVFMSGLLGRVKPETLVFSLAWFCVV